MHYDISTCSYDICPRCKLSILKENVIQEEDGDMYNYFLCNNCDLTYYGDDQKIFSLTLEKHLVRPGNNDPDPDWRDDPIYSIDWMIQWHIKNNKCISQKWPNGQACYMDLPLLPFDITIEKLEQLLAIA